MHSPMTAIFLDIILNLKSEIRGSVLWHRLVVNHIKTTFHYFFELEQVPLQFLSSEFHFRLQPALKFLSPAPITFDESRQLISHSTGHLK